jgi:hypothetical protein
VHKVIWNILPQSCMTWVSQTSGIVSLHLVIASVASLIICIWTAGDRQRGIPLAPEPIYPEMPQFWQRKGLSMTLDVT